MAENKKGFLMYASQKIIFESLTDEQAGQLIKHVFSYVNDEHPTTEDPFVKLAFALIQHQLKLDLDKWEERQGKNSEAGKKSAGVKSWKKFLLGKPEIEKISLEDHQFERGRCIKYMNESHSTYLFYHYEEAIKFHDSHINTLQQASTQSTPVEIIQHPSTKSTDSVSVSVSVNGNVSVNDITKRVAEFQNSLIPFLDSYPKEMIREFFDYWSEHGEKDRKFRMEKQTSFSIERRLRTWSKRQEQFEEKSSDKKESVTEQVLRVAASNPYRS